MKLKVLTTETQQQLIIKAETDYEQSVLKMFDQFPNTYWGDFEKNQAGYHRNFSYSSDTPNKDLIIVFPKQSLSDSE